MGITVMVENVKNIVNGIIVTTELGYVGINNIAAVKHINIITTIMVVVDDNGTSD